MPAVLALVAATAGIGLLAGNAAPASAAPTHIGIVVAGVGSACVPWHSGMTGADVLAGGGFTVTYGQQPPYQGFVLRVDGTGIDRPDNEHYWSYWKNTGSGWVYSSAGAPFAKVVAGTVEGWAYVDGRPQATQPPAASYADICAGQDQSTVPSPQTSVRPAQPAPPAAGSPAPPPAPAGGQATHSAPAGDAGAGPTPTLPTSEPATSTDSSTNPSTGRTAAETATAPSASPAPSAPSAPSRSTADPGSAGGSGLPPWGSAVGIAGVAALAGGAFWFNRRRQRSVP